MAERCAQIYFTIDDDINREVIPGTTWRCSGFAGSTSVLGVQRTGIYGGIKPC